MGAMTFSSLMSTRLASLLFISGKIARIFLFILLLLALKTKITLLSGYTLDQLLIFYLIYTLFDLLGQIFFRGIYWYRSDLLSGNFDFTLTKPLSPLFQVLVNHTDWLDIPPLILTVIFLIYKLPSVSVSTLLGFIFLSFLAMILITAVHIFVAAIGVLTLEVDHTIWIFRDLSQMARFPVDIYTQGVQFFLTYIIPIAFIFTFPAKILLGLLTGRLILITVLVTIAFYWLVIKFWHYALKTYASASS